MNIEYDGWLLSESGQTLIGPASIKALHLRRAEGDQGIILEAETAEPQGVIVIRRFFTFAEAAAFLVEALGTSEGVLKKDLRRRRKA